ncbi:hypothetical protein [Marinicella meishanensis]|uniref:hypothetical protein n=1 Tax=Marinicella meishanensis TaxID=2873263 RepID=UPI001CBFFED0|nr:hypothetical protein [Marinicella sp. NBU2979]
MKKTIQLHNPKQIEMGKKMTTEQILRFLDEFRKLFGHTTEPSTDGNRKKSKDTDIEI